MLDDIDQQLLQSYQRDFPLTENPFQEIGAALGIEEEEVIHRYQRLQEEGFISRIGPLVNHAKVGASTLVAIAAPPDTIETNAEIINSYVEINHNYLREHHYNLWFVVTAKDEARMHTVISEIESRTGCNALVLPMVKSFYIDLGFKLWQ
ncbi:MAG: Lrp/AsnC family transcriptional regulator [Gammaproteobacteria bacterium]|nr:Lrp/AsnC family transcriptional regulator [Gammaproteobacteria bacterium]MCP4089088.1 Lrp/AsnC family transcriptional regulator [Gammaproteobacteria bacterium]MCP4276887.1 Lrp/AsnC family transcriptional regulator [Gammaproteobacteria bacterium]MCP4830730.1 Lrp/AsnC family transcriptional regulator [Gammaproteobacteria bacterium]MCP4928846.1 Lrp/AsnC family transcriptional regulator [Gammaproteobacteria bacterium]